MCEIIGKIIKIRLTGAEKVYYVLGCSCWYLDIRTQWHVKERQILVSKMADKSDVKAIRDWLMKQPHLPQTLDDHLLGRFLKSCDESLERSKATLELFFSIRSESPEVFSKRDPTTAQVQDTFKLLDLVPLPELTPQGYSCFLLRFADPNPDKFDFLEVLKMFFMVGDIQIRSKEDLGTGLVPIFDMTGWSLKHITKIPLSSIRKYMQYCQEALPVTLKQIHIINTISLLDKILSLIRPLMRSEVAAMIHTHPTDYESLYQYVPKEILPKQYGGGGPSVEEIKDLWKKRVEGERGWFLKDEWKADDSKRVGKRIVQPEMKGSFRTLSFD